MTFYFLEHRPWDTDFFKKKMAKLSLTNVNGQNCFASVREAVSLAKKNDYEHIMIRLLSSETKSIVELEDASFRCYGALVVFQKKDISDRQQLQYNLNWDDFLQEGDFDSLEKWIQGLFVHSYMYKDPFFPREKVEQLYEVWLKNLLNASESVILVTRSEGAISGFVTVRPDTDCFEIDLFGVHPQYQRGGLSQKLLALASQYLLWKGVNLPLRVKTQGENIGAINAYIRSGFQIQEHHLTLCHNLSLIQEGQS